MTGPRPGDAYYLDVTFQGKQILFTIDAQNDRDAFYEAAYVLGGWDARVVPEEDRHPIGELCRLPSLDVVTSGDARHFEEMAQ